MALEGGVDGLTLNTHNVLIALDIVITLKMADEVSNGSKPGIAFSA